MMRKRFLRLALAAALFALAGPVGADVVLDWNEVTLDAIRVDRTAPPRSARALAVVQVAVYDAVVGILGGFAPYHAQGPAPAGASPEAAAVAAAHHALSSLFPAQAATFDAARTASLAAIPDGPAKDAGIAWGTQVADAILALRAGDGAGAVLLYESLVGAGWWNPTPPAFAAALLPQWPDVTPWAITSPAQFLAEPPPAPNSAEYTAAFREVRRFGESDSAFRSAEQTAIALFWADGPGTATPPGHWFEIAQDVSHQRGLSLLANARLLALLGIAVADAAIVSWENKYHYGVWRPIAGIRSADQDGNPATEAAPGWTPLIPTPPFPAFTSGHSTFSSASARVLALFFDTDQIAFTTGSDDRPGETRSFASFSESAAEAGQSRVYGGIHWQFDNTAGLATGRALGEHVFFNALTPLAPVAPCAPSATAACVQGGRFKVEASWATATAAGPANVEGQTADSAHFWFFHPDNTELLVKVLDACDGNDRFWVFASGLTNVEVLVRLTDTETGRVRIYFNPPGKAFAPVQDTDAFACQ